MAIGATLLFLLWKQISKNLLNHEGAKSTKVHKEKKKLRVTSFLRVFVVQKNQSKLWLLAAANFSKRSYCSGVKSL